MAFDDHKGTNRLAKTLTDRINQQIPSDLKLDFGTINGDWSLTTNTFPVKIPKGQWTVNKFWSGLSVGTSSNGAHGGHNGTETRGGHSHTVPMPRLHTGDRVLVAWVGCEACVICSITSSSSL